MMTVGCWLFSWLVGWLTNKRTDWLDGLLVWFAHTYLLTYVYTDRGGVYWKHQLVFWLFFFQYFLLFSPILVF